MSKRLFYAILFFGTVFSIIPEAIFAVDTATAFGGKIINEHANSLSGVLFGPVAKMAAIFGGAIGMISGFFHHSATQILTFGGIMLASVALPTLINGVYTMLLP